MEELAIDLVTEVVVTVLHGAGIPIPRTIVRRAVAMLIRQGLPYAEAATEAVRQLTSPDVGRTVKQKLRKGTEKILIELTCPIHDKDVEVPIDGNDADWSCPWCRLPIVVRGRDAEHAEVLGYDCPITGEPEYVAAEADATFGCRGCKLDVFVTETRKHYKVLHQVHLDDRDGGKPRQGVVTCPVSEAEVEVDTEDGTYHCTCGSDIEVTRGRATHERMLAFDCPLGETEEFVEAVEGNFHCTACRSDLRVYEHGHQVRVAHQLSIVD